jgi:hypothetical protein
MIEPLLQCPELKFISCGLNSIRRSKLMSGARWFGGYRVEIAVAHSPTQLVFELRAVLETKRTFLSLVRHSPAISMIAGDRWRLSKIESRPNKERLSYLC